MKLTFEIPDSVSEKKTFSKSKLEREVHAILLLRLYQDGFIPYQDISQILSLSFLESSKKESRLKTQKTNSTPGKSFLKLQGMWKNRADMKDTVKYIQDLRNRIGSREI
jgi:hypothetical protein